MNSKFIEEIGGEVRPSLETIVGLSDLLLDMEISNEQRTYIETIQRNGQDVIQLLGSVLDLVRLEAGTFESESYPFNLRMTIEDAFTRLAIEARERQTELTYYLAHNGVDIFQADGKRIQQIISNLLSNAVNRTIGGEVFLEGHRYIEDERCLLYISVRDTGMKLPPALLIELNQSAGHSANLAAVLAHPDHFPLFMSRALIHQLDGDIWFENDPDGGTIVTLSLNAIVDSQEHRRRQNACHAIFEGKRVLVVDDSALSREVLKRQLESWCIRPVLAESASVALHLLQPGAEFDAVLIDEVLEDMNGITLAAAIRHRDEMVDTPLILLGNSREVDQRYWRLFATSVDKPLRSYQLYERLRSILAGSSTANLL